ncbi:hypothetical protein [Streptomyces aidingensis]|uniref:Ca-activated chloride channel family protein n=1 Tax=Streptomyces aidingensis TaxID=910347 RepID=A0A1I1QLB3_9ACTN|nr:hypothetical protein [Streptomyces aidingensis]SFD22839.1 hypothetical protein SAMN05421773_111162 [Streptomyces aidingensis]
MVGARIGVAAGVCALVLAAPSARAAEDAGTEGYRPAERAEAVRGTASTADAPAIEAGGIYTDEIGPGEELYYSLVMDDIAGYAVSAVAAPRPGSEVAYGDGIAVQLQSTGGEDCALEERAAFGSDLSARPVSAWTSRLIAEDGRCQTAGTYLLRVTRESAEESDQAVWPTEIRVMREPAISGGPLAAPPESGWLTEVPTPPAGQARVVTGGTGFNDAQPVGDGVWRDDIAPGQTLFYRVPVDWHQQLAVTVELANAPLGDQGYAFVGDGLLVEAYNPARGEVAELSGTYTGDPLQVQGVLPPAAYANRTDAAGTAAGAMIFSGWHYLAVHLKDEVGEITDAGSIGLHLRVSVEGEPAAGPEYAEDAAEAGFGITEADRLQAEEGKTDEAVAAERRDGRVALGLGSLGAGVALLAVLGLWTLLARRRAAATATAAAVRR